MPELPEVETVRRGLEKLVVGKTIAAIRVGYPRMIGTGATAFQEELVGQTITGISRRGKYLLIQLGEQVIVSHLRMEGKYLLFPDVVPTDKHFHIFFELTDGSTLVYQDVRKFGTMELFSQTMLDAYFLAKKLGPDPTEEDFQLSPFLEKLSRSKKPIKSHLLDQSLVAGLGNIYVDEVLFRASVHPKRLSASLSAEEAEAIFRETIAVLQLGIEKGGSTIRSYRNALGLDGTMQNYLQVYGKTGQPCPRCQTDIVKMQLGGRGTHFCPHCQEEI